MADYNKIIDFVYIPTGNTPNIDTEDILIGQDGFAYAHGVKFISESVIDGKISTAISDGISGYALFGKTENNVTQINLTALKNNTAAGTVKFKGGGVISISYDTTDGITISSTDSKTATAQYTGNYDLPILVNRTVNATSAGTPRYLLKTTTAGAYINPSKATLYATNVYATTMQKNGVDVATVNDLNLAIASGIIYKGKINTSLPTYANGVRQGHAYIWNGSEDTYNKGDMLIAYTTGTNNTVEWSVVEHNIDDTAIQNAIGISQNGVVTLGDNPQDLFTYNGTHTIQAKIQRAGENLGIIGADPEQISEGEGIAALKISNDGFGYITYSDRLTGFTSVPFDSKSSAKQPILFHYTRNTIDTPRYNIDLAYVDLYEHKGTIDVIGDSSTYAYAYIRNLKIGSMLTVNGEDVITSIIRTGTNQTQAASRTNYRAVANLNISSTLDNNITNITYDYVMIPSYEYLRTTYLALTGGTLQNTSTTNNANITFPQTGNNGIRHINHGINGIIFNGSAENAYIKPSSSGALGILAYKGLYISTYNNDDWTIYHYNNSTYILQNGVWIKGSNAVITPQAYLDGGAFLSNKLVFKNNSALPKVESNPPFIVGMNSFSDGGYLTWTPKSGVTVGNATNATNVNIKKISVTTTNYPLLIKGANNDTDGNNTVRSTNSTHAYINPNDTTTELYVDNILSKSVKVNGSDVLTSVPTATPSMTGGILASGTANNSTTLTKQTSNTDAKYYGVYVSSTGYGYVNVPWTDAKVGQISASANTDRPILMKYGHTDTTTVTGSVVFDKDIYINPSTNTITAPNIVATSSLKVNGKDVLTSVPTATPSVTGGILASGTANNSTTLINQTSNTGAKYYGVYVSSTGYGYVNVPWTDTHYTSKTYLTNSSSSTSNVSNISNGSVHITHAENTSASASTVNSFIKIVGDGGVLAYVKEANTLTLYAANALSAQYAASTLTNDDLEPAIGDTFETAISKIHKAILDNEKVIASALNDLNDRLSELESKITGTPLNWKIETTV